MALWLVFGNRIVVLLCGCDSDDEQMNQHQDTFLGVLHGENKGLMLGAQHYGHCAGVGAGHQSHWSLVPLQPVYLVVSALGMVFSTIATCLFSSKCIRAGLQCLCNLPA